MKYIFLAISILFCAKSFGDCASTRTSFEAAVNACVNQTPAGCSSFPITYFQWRVAYYTNDSIGIAAWCQAKCTGDWYNSYSISPFIPKTCEKADAATESPPKEKPNSCTGSTIQVANQILGESIPITGAPFTLNYYSNWVVGRVTDYNIKFTISGPYVPATATSYDLTVYNEVGTSVYTNSFGTSTNQTYAYTWNGLDASSVQPWGTVTYSGKVKQNTSTSVDPEITKSVVVGSLKSKKLGMGAWLPSIWHFYDANSGTLYKGDGSVRKVTAVSSGGYYRVAEEDTSLVYYFTTNGKISHTKLGLTGTAIYTFNYDGSGRLSSIDEPFSKTTTINRDGSGNFTGITASNGAITTVTLDGNDYLASVTNPNSEVYSMTYVNADGLLYTFTKPNSAVSTFTYDGVGQLTGDSHSGGYSSTLSKSGNVVTLTSAVGRVVTNTLNADTTETQVLPTGQSWTMSALSSGVTITYPHWNSTENYTTDPRFSEGKRISTIYSSSFGNRSESRAKTMSGMTDPFTFTSMTDTSTTSANVITSVYTTSNKTFSVSSALGRTASTVIDTYQRPTLIKIGNITPTTFTYTNELLTSIDQGVRNTTLTYNSTSKLLETITNDLSQVTSFTYDSAQRLSSQTLPDSRVINYTYDSKGNLTSITPPGGYAHTFNFGSKELASSYLAPTASGVSSVTTSYSYNNDNQLTQITRPSGATITYNYNSTTGLLSTITGSFGTYTQSYNSYKQPNLMVAPSGFRFNTTWLGKTPSAVSLTDAAFNTFYSYSRTATGGSVGEKIASETIQGASGTRTFTYGYNNDEMLTSVGDITLSYNFPNGQLTGTTIGNVTDTYTYNSFGEVTGYDAKYSGTTFYSYTLTRDDLGRVTQKVETLNGVTTTFDYTYDSAGRLTQVDKNGSTDSTYSYDSNSNRTGGNIHGTTTTATYDDQDRISAFNLNTYTHNDNGEIVQKVNSGTSTTTNYTWDVLGNLGSAQVGATVYTYGIDPGLNRYEKKTGSTVNERYGYNPEGKLVSVLNSSNALQKAFVYASKTHAPDYYIDSGSNKYRIISDYLGSVRVVINTATGSVAQIMEHDEFGRVVQDSAPGTQPFGFTGGIWSSSENLLKLGRRIYDSEIGRWLTKDPILFEGGDMNLYGYVLADPVNLIDPSGLEYWEFDGGAGTLSLVNDDNQRVGKWSAVSGPWGKGKLPAGTYKLNGSPSVGLTGISKRNSYCDRSGNCWFQPISSPDIKNRNGLGVHPDGGTPGTAGCIGATGNDTSSLLEFVKTYGKKPLYVK